MEDKIVYSLDIFSIYSINKTKKDIFIVIKDDI